MAGAFFRTTARRHLGAGDVALSGTPAGPARLTTPATATTDRLPGWVTLFRAPNPGPMTLDGTNTWVVRTAPDTPAVVIDAGPLDEGHLRAVADSGPVGAVLTTHRHPDHVEGLNRLIALTGADTGLAAGAARDGGSGPSGEVDLGDGYGVRVRRIATPGHTGDSVCFEVAVGDERVVFTGDTILGRGTTVVAWPDGDLGDYLASLGTLSAYPGVPVLPGHGPALADCAEAAAFYLAHRHARLEQVRAAVDAGAGTPAEVVDQVYADVGDSLRTAAEWSVRAQLAYLRQESEARSGRLDLP